MQTHQPGNRPLSGREQRAIHRTFVVGIILKGLDGVLEIAGAVVAYLANPTLVGRWVAGLTSRHRWWDWHDFVSHHLQQFVSGYNPGTQLFFTLFLLSHGIVKVFLVASLLRRRLWAYPTAVTVFALFIFYQVWRYTITHSVWMIVLTVLDLFVIALTVLEYRNVRRMFLRPASAPARAGT